MENKEIIDRIETKMLEIFQETSKGLEILNKRQMEVEKSVPINSEFSHGMYSNQCDEAYYRNVARFAWAYRAKQIAILELRSTLNEIKKELK